MSSINYFGHTFFASLGTPTDAGLSASWASQQTRSKSEAQNGKPSLAKQVGTYSGVTNGSQFDWTKEGAETMNKLSHVKTHMDYTVKNPADKTGKFLTAAERMDRLSTCETGAIMVVIKILKVDGTTTPPFLTFLGLPTTALNNSKATIVAEDMLPTPGMMEPCNVTLPPECRPILATALANTRDMKPAALKLKLWAASDSTLLFLKGEEMLKPLLFEEIESGKPAPETDMEAAFLGRKEDFQTKLATDPAPKIYAYPKNQESPEQQAKTVGCWYGAPAVFMPPVHNLPLGFAMNPTHAKSGKNIKEAIMAFFEVDQEDTTLNFLESPYIDSWCRMMSQNPEEFAQTAVSLRQVRTSWFAVVHPPDQANISHALQATFAHMECLIMHRIFRDALVSGAGKKWLGTLLNHEKILKLIFDMPAGDEDEEEQPPLGNVEIAMQAYAYYLVAPATKSWDTKQGFAELRGAMPAPNLARRFKYFTDPPKKIEGVTDTTRLMIKNSSTTETNIPDLTGTTVETQNPPENRLTDNMMEFLTSYSQCNNNENSHNSPLTVRTIPKKRGDKTKKRQSKHGHSSSSEGSTDSSSDDEQEKRKSRKKKSSKIGNSTTTPLFPPERDHATDNGDTGVHKKPSTEVICLGVKPPSPYKPTVHTKSITRLKDQWKTPAALQGSLQHYVTGPQALTLQDLIAVKAPTEDERDDYFTAAAMIADPSKFERPVKLVAHLLAHCLPETAATQLKPQEAPAKSMDVSYLMHPGNLGGEFHKNVVAGKLKDLKQKAGSFLMNKMKLAKNHKLPGKPQFQPSFFKSERILKPLRAQVFDKGDSVTAEDDLDNAFTPFHMIASIDTGESNEFRLPARGLRTTAMAQVICNLFAIFHIMAEDEKHFPNIPLGSSTFSLLSPLGGALCQTIQHLQKVSISSAWDEIYDKHGTITQTVKLLYMLGELLELFSDWSETRPTSVHYQVTTPRFGPDYDRHISLLGTEILDKDEKNLRLELEAWAKRLTKSFGAANLEKEKNNPVKSHTKEPPTPCAPPAAAAARHGGGNYDPQHGRIKIKQENTPAGAKQGDGQTRRGQRQPTQTAPQKSKSNGTPRLINFSPAYIRKQGGKAEYVGKMLFELKTANNLAIPYCGDKPVCFPFIMEEGCDDCFARKGPRSSEKCSENRSHINLQGGSTPVTKNDLQPLYTYLQNEHVAKQLVPTEAFKKFMN